MLCLHLVRIFAYGSLINRRSAARTLTPEALATQRPAVAVGGRRIFNRDIPAPLIVQRYGVMEHGRQRAALNLLLTADRRDRVNGVLFDVDEGDLAALIEREAGYRIERIELLSGEFAYTFIAEPEATSEDITPIPGYYADVKEGAAKFGHSFLADYMEQTYLANNKTTIATMEKRQ